MSPDSEVLEKLPEWHKVLREIYEGVELDKKAKSGSSRRVADRGSR
jgi:hypothetical protein